MKCLSCTVVNLVGGFLDILVPSLTTFTSRKCQKLCVSKSAHYQCIIIVCSYRLLASSLEVLDGCFATSPVMEDKVRMYIRPR